jgi:polyhydroxybutyrate depolymerase
MKAIVLSFMFGAGLASADCGPQDGPCLIAEGSYHVVLPDGAGPHPAVVFVHGYGSSGEGSFRNTGMMDTMIGRGYAVIAPDGQPRESGDGRSWDFHPERPASRDESAFIRSVADDAAARFGLDREDMLLTGFSVGGSMVSYLACAAPQAFRAYAPVGGNFWRPEPAECAGPVSMLHTHGWTDTTVPLEGRRIGNDFVQGDVFEALETWRRTDGCDQFRPDAFSEVGDFHIRSWTDCTAGARLDFALHFGGHSIPRGWSALALDWFEALD